ncbi:hypothetical protein [Streptomyces scopuliridis]|uniref:Uncharacterized protein n=1 Tax=Streptomyces scopuliridis RB72 TaxID=1440053 RepID=A0A2T7T218_9ACTN|nr:hypothetical protein [Streptomyces scopuliridis]PVE09212.1 hypothetical protein Y717_01035 [Streptomyces scopuliridis RB72]
MDQRPGSGTRQDESEVSGERRAQRLELSVPQVAGSAFAAVAAAVLASRLGVYGTIVGAGVVSVIATCGGPVLQHLFRRTGEQIREVTVQVKPGGRQVPVRDDPADPPVLDGEFGEATTHGTRVRGWKRPLRAAVVVFVVAMVGITGFELAAGQDLNGGKGTTVGYVVRGGGGDSTPSKDPANSPDPGGDPSGTPDGRSSGGTGGTDPGGSPGTGPSTGTDTGQGGGTDPSATPSTTPSATPSGSGASSPAPTPSDGSGSTGTSDPGTGNSATTGP